MATVLRAVLVVGVLSTLALADDAADKKDAEQQLAEAVKGLEADCGAKVKVRYEWGSEAKVPGRPAAQGPVYCESIIKGLANACSRPVVKELFGAAVSSITCRVEDGASKKQVSGAVLTLDGAALTASYDWNSSNLESEAYTWAHAKMPVPGANGPVSVQATEEKREGEQRFAEAVAALNEKCGGKISARYDFASEKGNAAKPAWQGYLYCKGVIDGLASACETRGAKVGKKLATIECRFQAGAAEKQVSGAVLAVKKKALHVSYDWHSANLETEAFAWAGKTLK